MADTTPRPFVFVLMPFDESFSDVYQLGIRPACESAGSYCERVDEQIFAESILTRIYNQIAKADLIVADMTGRNPNVFYEVGYAHALGNVGQLLPLDWTSMSVGLDADRLVEYMDSGRSVPLELRLFTPVGSQTIEFSLKLYEVSSIS